MNKSFEMIAILFGSGYVCTMEIEFQDKIALIDFTQEDLGKEYSYLGKTFKLIDDKVKWEDL